MNNRENSKKQRKVPVILNYEEQKLLLKQPNPKAPTGLRNICMLTLMLDAGLRLSEVINLKPEDINFEDSRVILRQERDAKEERTLWLGADTLELLQRWLKIRPDCEYLFCTLKGGRLDDRYIREMVKRLSTKAGIKKNIFPHSLRHTFAADLYKRTRNICLVQEALGHADLSTTMVYANLIEEDLEEAMKLFVAERRPDIPLESVVMPLPIDEPQDVVTDQVEELEKVASEEAATAEKETVKIPEQPERDVPVKKEIQQKRIVSMHAIKCKCGNIVSRKMDYCSECGKNIEDLLDQLRQDFYRINFTTPPK